jgi:heme A synthase
VRNFGALSGLAALLVLAVVATSATLRNDELASVVAVARVAQRVAASLAALAVFAIAWLGWRDATLRPAALGALALTVALSIIGVATGIKPPLAAALANQIGGLALAALLAWLCGRAAPAAAQARAGRPLATLALALAAIQAFGGALLATLWKDAPAALYIFHAAGGLAAALLLAALGPRYGALGALAPLLGAAAVISELPAIPQVLHVLAAATLLAAAAHAHGRASA